MRFIFGIQSEGHGHITQACALKEILTELGHDVILTIVPEKTGGLPSHIQNISQIFKIKSFNFRYNKDGSFSIIKTFIHSCIQLPKILQSYIQIINKIKELNPDYVVNFYEPLVGLSAIWGNAKHFSIGHQYFMNSNSYPNVNGYFFQKMFLRIINKITSINSKQIALSFYPKSHNDIIVMPPLLRMESYIKNNNVENFILVYLIREEVISELIEIAKQFPDETFHCFIKKTKEYSTSSNVILYNIDPILFQEKMKVCKAVICSGGFETSSEAILQEKKLLMIPVKNHFEQLCNSIDAQTHGYCITSSSFDIKSLLLFKQNSHNDWLVKDVWIQFIKYIKQI